MRYVIATLAALILASGFSVGEAAAQVKIAVVDVQKVIMTSRSGQTADAKIKSEFGPIQDKINQMESELKKLQEQAKKAEDSSVLSESAKQSKREAFQEKFQEYQQKGQQWEQELRKRQRDLTESLLEKVKLIVADIARKKGYTVVFEKGDQSPLILYSADSIDITLDVVKQIDK